VRTESEIGVALSAYLTEGCRIEWHADTEHVNFEFGEDPTILELSVTEGGLVELVQEFTDALRTLRFQQTLE
jgi:hypothetical protein